MLTDPKKIPEKMSTSQARYNNSLFKNLIPVYDTVAFFLGPVRTAILNDLALPKHSTVLDVACGTGTQAILLSEHEYDVTGIDLSSAMLKQAKLKAKNPALSSAGLRFIKGDATKLPFEDNTFDASTISFGLHDMPEEIRVNVLAEMKRVTKKHGKILVADYATPADGILAKLERPISNIFESKYFDSFMSTGLDKYISDAKLVQKKKDILLMGIAQLITCIK